MDTMARKPTHPGAILRFDYLEPLALTVTGLAVHLGVSRKHLSAVVNERAGVSVDLALRLARAFGTSPDLWLNLQRKRDLWEAQHAPTGWQDVALVPNCAGRTV
ncbi:HigA family addiction module antitoxin [Megalodesulfovibrio gigas]|uniref:Putative XRE family transcriptional regulator n=1 Tax=Megalodesulfovibrio gigas (strain ATCC 19364 / DSM 1382 / NCIMB 9332 / VKM B-1759) TaxID=1121448 RepID=T2G721_MEGG1|nr:HigA family addiction module antitoxin [Megalodesulfovibrio gigas]AGW11946.1 putative XRE family transcriptional regulator [Megalodesulfovibrio gigas DSM 1382 = ATCC 19364]